MFLLINVCFILFTVPIALYGWFLSSVSLLISLFKLVWSVVAFSSVIALKKVAIKLVLPINSGLVLKKSIIPNSFKYIIFSTAEVSGKSSGSSSRTVLGIWILSSVFLVSKNEIILLKCTSTYPASPENSNLLTIPHLSLLHDCHVGLSDHTMGIGTSVAAVALGASIIEKHFTLDRTLPGPDHLAS